MNVLIIGTGDIAYSHAKAVERLGGKIIGAYDINQESLFRFAETFNCIALAYEQIGEQLKNADYAVICTPPSKRIDYVALNGITKENIIINAKKFLGK